ncbi:hypothetical protein MNBD_ALPHA09-1966 [hydrothermal vent metagenome]|uniref:N-acetyltransferase domain-containing protein n=1 Tax=hydrothermal vent metagenome TaxID=652676 RepID=A0A3B0TNF9_9ZZZZ
MTDLAIRPALEADVPGICEIYNYFIRETTITFDLEEVSLENRLKWVRQFGATGRHRLFVAEAQSQVAGFAYSSQYRAKAGYDTTIETTIYTRPGLERRGGGRALYGALFDALAGEDVHRAIAVITEPNAASDGLHGSFGFIKIGVLSDVGYKFGRFHSTGYWEKMMAPE